MGAFWSLTMYGDDLYLVDNPIGRYAIGDRTPGLRRGRDGSLTLHHPARGRRAARARQLAARAPRAASGSACASTSRAAAF